MPPYDFSNKNMRRVGLSYLGNGGQPKLQLEDPTDPITDGSPPYPSPIRPTPFTKRNRPTSTYNKPVPKRLVSSSGDDDDLTSPNVPNISRPAAKSRSRQTSVDPNYGGRTADKTLGSLGGVPTGGNFKPTTYLAALTAGKVPEKAQEEALRQEPRRPEPSQVWDGFVTKRRRQPAVYYQRKGSLSGHLGSGTVANSLEQVQLQLMGRERKVRRIYGCECVLLLTFSSRAHTEGEDRNE